MIFAMNKDLKKAYYTTLFSSNLRKWQINQTEQIQNLIGEGSYGQVFEVQLEDDLSRRTVAKKVSRTRGNSRILPDDFVREFGILEMLSHATTKVDRLIKMVGVNIQRTPHGEWQTPLYTTFNSEENLADYLTQ